MNTKKVKKTIAKKAKVVEKKGKELETYALKEYAKVKKQMETTGRKVESYIKKNPEKAAAISAGVGLALGAVAGILASKGKKKK